MRLTVAVCVATLPSRARSLERALASVRAQTRQPDEVVVVADEGGDGAAVTRNRAWRAATKDVIAWLDDDDEFLPRHLELCMGPLEAGSADMVYSWMERPTWHAKEPLAVPVGGRLVHPLGVPFGPEQRAHLRHHSFSSSTILVRRVWLERVGGYPTGNILRTRYYGHDDWGVARRLAESGARIVHVPVRTWVYNAAIP